METIESGKHALISSIERGARVEAENLITEAEKQVEERKKYIEKQVQSILKEAKEKAAEQSEAVKRKMLSGVDIEVKRQKMRTQDTLLNTVISQVEEELCALVKKPEYRTILLNWVVEAAIGLSVESAEIGASKDELRYIDKKFLSEAEKEIKSIQGSNVKLKLSDKPALHTQGVILTAGNGRTAFNNQVKTRLLRKQREIRKSIYDKLFIGD